MGKVMIAPALRLILGAFEALAGLTQMALTLWDAWLRAREKHFTLQGTAESISARSLREDFVWGALCFVIGAGLVFGPSVTGYVFLFATPLALLMLVWRHRKRRAHQSDRRQGP